MMLVDIAKIKTRPGTWLDFSFTDKLDAAACGYDDFRIVGDVVAEGRITSLDDGSFTADLRYTANVEQCCSRCGKRFCQPAAGMLQARFSTSPQEDADGEEECHLILHEQADLAPVILQEIGFRLPMQPLCRQDCRGLCPTCGADLNEGCCSCTSEQIDPRWEKLKNLSFDDD